MSNLQSVPKTLFEIIKDVLVEHEDSNLSSETARTKIADDICMEYYDEIGPYPNKETIYTEDDLHIDDEACHASDNLDYDNVNWGTHIANDDFSPPENENGK